MVYCLRVFMLSAHGKRDWNPKRFIAGEAREETVAWSKDTYQLLKQAEQGKVKSYVQDIALAVLDCKETAISRQTFIRLMNERGYGVD